MQITFKNYGGESLPSCNNNALAADLFVAILSQQCYKVIPLTIFFMGGGVFPWQPTTGLALLWPTS